MTLEAVKTIRSLRRGLAVMRELERLRVAGLDELHLNTRIPKATIARILLTLQEEKYVSQRIADNKWVIGSEFSARPRRIQASDRLAQAAAPALNALCNKIVWPSDLSVRSGLRMVLKETSRPHSSLTLNRLRIDFPIDMLMSAPGRAYLAFCPANERELLLKKLHDRRLHAWVFEHGYLANVIEETRRNGFGARDPAWGGHISRSKSDYDDGLDAIAVPLRCRGIILGCINIIWIRKLVSQNDMAERYLSELLGTADQIAHAYAGLTS